MAAAAAARCRTIVGMMSRRRDAATRGNSYVPRSRNASSGGKDTPGVIEEQAEKPARSGIERRRSPRLFSLLRSLLFEKSGQGTCFAYERKSAAINYTERRRLRGGRFSLSRGALKNDARFFDRSRNAAARKSLYL